LNQFYKLYKRGINLGGWISQYKEHSEKPGDPHFENFIKESDIALIASFGLDHVRLPVDYMIFEQDDNVGIYDEAGLAYVDRCLEWCKKNNLNLLIEFHHAPGYSFEGGTGNHLFDDPKQQQRFIDQWTFFTKRYIGEGDNVAFELLNEVFDKDSTRWNALAARLVAAIRELDKERFIMIGGNMYGNPACLKEIDIIPNDDRIVYAFHYYDPLLFTHQFANWISFCHILQKPVTYPSTISGIGEFLKANPEYENDPNVTNYVDKRIDYDHMRELLQPCIDFIERTGKQLHCSEFGAIEVADTESRIHWHKDFYSILDEYEIGYSVWNYKLMNFSFVNEKSEVVSKELFELTAGKK